MRVCTLSVCVCERGSCSSLELVSSTPHAPSLTRLHTPAAIRDTFSPDDFYRARGNAPTILHYAVCVRSLRAASALLIIAPHMASQTCLVEPGQGAANGFPEKKMWTTQDLLRLLCSVYAVCGEANASAEVVKEIMEAYVMSNLARAVLNGSACVPMQLPFVNLPTVQELVAAAGCDADSVIAALVDAGRLTLCENGKVRRTATMSYYKKIMFFFIITSNFANVGRCGGPLPCPEREREREREVY